MQETFENTNWILKEKSRSNTGCLKKTDTQILQNAILLGKIDQKRCKLQNT